jgi:dihydrodipicolinate synthase/N-acetylneuraminate lyase
VSYGVAKLFFQPKHLSRYYEEIEGKKFIFYSIRKRKGVLTNEKTLEELRRINNLYIVNQTSPALEKLKLSVVDSENELGNFITNVLE